MAIKPVTEMEVRQVELEEIAEREYGHDATGYRLSALRMKKQIAKRYENIRAWHRGNRMFTPHEIKTILVDCEALAEDGPPADRNLYAGIAFNMLMENA